MSELFSRFLACDGECGTKIELTSRDKKDVVDGMLDSCAEVLGWTTRDYGKQTEVYCPFCQKRARRIVDGR